MGTSVGYRYMYGHDHDHTYTYTQYLNKDTNYFKYHLSKN